MDFPETICGYDAKFTKRSDPENSYYLYLSDGVAGVAKVNWLYDDQYVRVDLIDVEPGYRRQGIATEVFDRLREITGLPIRLNRDRWSDQMVDFGEPYMRTRNVINDDGTIAIVD